jgi:uncharacterized membrane protein YkvA (DUF1232 family)
LRSAVAAYALSPIDLIPDFIPILGYLDDLVILPLGIMLAVKLVPADLMAEFRAAAITRRSDPVLGKAARLLSCRYGSSVSRWRPVWLMAFWKRN